MVYGCYPGVSASSYAPLTAQTYQVVAQLAQATQQTMEQVIGSLLAQPAAYIEARPGVQ